MDHWLRDVGGVGTNQKTKEGSGGIEGDPKIKRILRSSRGRGGNRESGAPLRTLRTWVSA